MECLQKYPRGLSHGNLARLVRNMQFEVEEKGPDSLDAQLTYLKSCGFIEPVAKAHTPSNELWQLTAAGDDHLRTRFSARK